MSEPADIIRQRSTDVLDEVLRTKVGFSRMVKQMVAHTIKEYRGRFLHELIQNGYDAHPPGTREGKIAIHFNEAESDYGVLYVANGGLPLSESNFARMASLGESDKVIGVGIGNKGVGFKSVFQICNAPEVYSALDAEDAGFSGYSFRFGTKEDLSNLLGQDAAKTEKVAENLSLSLLTIPLDTTPDAVLQYRNQGYVTVLRLPASSARAAQDIKERINRLLLSKSPVMLFLQRLNMMSIQASSVEEPVVLTRQEKSAEEYYNCVVLNGDTTYQVFHKLVPSAQLQAALQKSVAENSLDERWLNWTAEAHVSVAVSQEDTVENGQAYTYLPMGESASSPLSAHINAPFVTNFARVGLDNEQPVNQLLLSCIAELCLESASTLICLDANANTVVDLLAWHDTSLEIIKLQCSALFEKNFSSFIRLPDHQGDWSTLDKVSIWLYPNCKIMTADAVVNGSSASLIDLNRLDPIHIGKVTALASRLGTSLMPSSQQLSDWVEAVAGKLHSREASVDEWADFYDDMSLLFQSSDVLTNRHLLLTEDGQLAPTNASVDQSNTVSKSRKRQRTVFFSPQAGGEEDAEESNRDIKTPGSLKKRMLFMHPEIPWYNRGQRRPGRAFLEDQGLVQPFRTERLLRLISQTATQSNSAAIKSDALKFAFRLYANNPSKHTKELASLELEIPTQTGTWIPAAQAKFGDPWPVQGASELTSIAEAATDQTPDLASLAGFLIPGPSIFAGPSGQAQEWRSFLETLGVSSQLPIWYIQDNRSFAGRDLRAPYIAGYSVPADVPPPVIDQWRVAISGPGNFAHPNTQFATEDPLCWFMGQHEIELLPRRVRDAYAKLVVRALPSLVTSHWNSTWRRDRPNGEQTHIPTPLAAFLLFSPWIPTAQPGTDQRVFEPPFNAWYVSTEDQTAASYAPLVDPALRRLIDSLPNSEHYREELGLKLWGSPNASSDLINLLTTLFANGDIPDRSFAHLRSSLAQSWNHVGNPLTRTRPQVEEGLLVERAGDLQLLQPEDANEASVFVTSASDQSTTARLVRELSWPILTVDSNNPTHLREIAEAVLREPWPGAVEVTTDWNLEVHADGLPWAPSESAPKLSDEIPWLAHLIACTMRFPRGSGLRIGNQLPGILEKIARLRFVKCSFITIGDANGQNPLPDRLRGLLPFPGETPTLLVEHADTPITWGQLTNIAAGVLELIEQTQFTAEVSLNLLTLGTSPDDPIFRPDNGEIAAALHAPLVQIDEAETLVYGAVVGIADKLLQVAPCLWGEEALTALYPASSLTREELEHTVAALCGGDHAEAGRLIDAATVSINANALRRRLEIPLNEYNESVSLYFPSAKLVDYGFAHHEEFELRKGQRRSELIEIVRACRFEQFLAGIQQVDWPELRELNFLHPEVAWNTTLDELGNELIDRTMDQQLVQRLGEAPNPRPPLTDWEQVRQENGRPLREKLSMIERVLAAWHRKRRIVSSIPAWGEAFVDTTYQRLERVGALDFTVLDESALVLWLAHLNIWPDELEATMDLSRLGLTDEEVNAARSEQELAREAKRRADRQVHFNGQTVELEPSMSNWVDTLRDELATLPSILEVPYRSAQLEDLAVTGARTRGSSGMGSRGMQTSRLSDAQRTAIGMAGEYVAFQWLRAKDPSEAVDETCWKSASVAYFFEGMTGDDSLGYDFEVPRKSGSVMYEVKATSVDAGTIELGETEVACAQEHARNERWRLLIVENALSHEPQIHMLPNPFHRNSRSQFSFVGNSLRLRFKLRN